MITKDNLADLLEHLGFEKSGKTYKKYFPQFEAWLKVDFGKKKIYYPVDRGLKINQPHTCSFDANENFVVLECVHRLLEKGYKPEHIELEPQWKLGHGASGGRADILIKDNTGDTLLIIECKTAGREHTSEWENMQQRGGQLFSYVQQDKSTQFVCLYSCDFIDARAEPEYQLINLQDNENLLEEKRDIARDVEPLSFKDAHTVEELHAAWMQTYEGDYATRGLFEKSIPAYEIGKTKYSVEDLARLS